jgi:hypothetical protein
MTVVCECVFCDVVVCAQFGSTIRDVKQSTDEKQHRRNSDNDNDSPMRMHSGRRLGHSLGGAQDERTPNLWGMHM